MRCTEGVFSPLSLSCLCLPSADSVAFGAYLRTTQRSPTARALSWCSGRYLCASSSHRLTSASTARQGMLKVVRSPLSRFGVGVGVTVVVEVHYDYHTG